MAHMNLSYGLINNFYFGSNPNMKKQHNCRLNWGKTKKSKRPEKTTVRWWKMFRQRDTMRSLLYTYTHIYPHMHMYVCICIFTLVMHCKRLLLADVVWLGCSAVYLINRRLLPPADKKAARTDQHISHGQQLVSMRSAVMVPSSELQVPFMADLAIRNTMCWHVSQLMRIYSSWTRYQRSDSKYLSLVRLLIQQVIKQTYLKFQYGRVFPEVALLSVILKGWQFCPPFAFQVILYECLLSSTLQFICSWLGYFSHYVHMCMLPPWTYAKLGAPCHTSI